MAIDVDGDVDIFHHGVGTCAEAPAPHRIAHDPPVPAAPDSGNANSTTKDDTTAARQHDRKHQPEALWRRRGLIAAALIAGAIAGWAGIYGIGALKRNAAGDPACRGRWRPRKS